MSLCKKHGALGAAVTGSSDVKIEGKRAIRVGDAGVYPCLCKSWSAETGSASVLVNGKPIHREKDRTSGGVLATYSETVLVAGANPWARPPKKENCKGLLAKMRRLLMGVGDRQGKNKGLYRRFMDLRLDRRKLYLAEQELKKRGKFNPNNPGIESWTGHQNAMKEKFEELERTYDDWLGSNCECGDQPDDDCGALAAMAKEVVEVGIPDAPDSVLGPPTLELAPWVKKLGGRIVDGVLLVPAAVGSGLLGILQFVAFVLGIELKVERT
jgi:uncharacterized Zn-binding protein involved in type VI secretion